MPNIRRARAIESETLTNIAIASEAYWGYDSSFMENFKTIYRVSEEFIYSNPTYVIEDNEDIIGFFSLLIGDAETSLEYMYVKPEYIGKGYGRLLWCHMVDVCRSLNADRIILVTSPQAKDFYIKMGAELIGEVDSLVIKDRKIPKLAYTVSS